jgi:hypothetical protein
MRKVAALFVEEDGVYSNLPNIDLGPKKRDARKYDGPYPIIAHPPCQRWGKFAKINYNRWDGEHNKPGNDGGCFSSALSNLKRYGGVLEHPAQSYAWPAFNLPKKKNTWVLMGDVWTCEVWQSAYGHRANKSTWLAYVGVLPPFDLDWSRPIGACQIGFHDQRGKNKNKPTLSRKEANATPICFRDVLIALAEYSRTTI